VEEELHSPEVAADRVEAAESNGALGDGQTAAGDILVPNGTEESAVLSEGTEPPTGETWDPFRG
jgi:hypothetical protein